MKSITLFLITLLFSLSVFGQDEMTSKLFKGRQNRNHNILGKPARITAPQANKISLDSMISDGFYKSTVAYNAIGQDINEIQYEWDSDSEEWILYSKIEYSYANGNQSTEVWYEWDSNSSEWIYDDKTEFTYTNDLLELSSDYSWDNNANQWKQYRKTEYSYTNNNLTLESSYYWNPSSSQWDTSNKTEYLYSNGKLISETESSWNASISQWYNLEKEELFYDVNGNVISLIRYEWYGSSWVNYWKYDGFVYDNSIAYADMVLPTDIGRYDFFNHKLISVSNYIWNTTNSQWEFRFTDQLYYSPSSITSVKKPLIEVVKLYPNPIVNELTIEVIEEGNVSVYNNQGVEVINENFLIGTHQVSLASAPAGLYTIYFKGRNDKMQQVKIMKQ